MKKGYMVTKMNFKLVTEEPEKITEPHSSKNGTSKGVFPHKRKL